VEAQYGRYVGGQRSVDHGGSNTTPTTTSVDDWKKLDRNEENNLSVSQI
jgi:hypothetical protein